MRKIFISLLLVTATIHANAQLSVVLQGKKVIRTSKVNVKGSTEAMGQTMEQEANTNSIIVYTTKSVTDKEMVFEQVNEKLKMNMSMMGQEIEFDSDKPDNDVNLAPMAEAIKKPIAITVNLNGVVIKNDVPEEMASMMGQMGSSVAAKDIPVDFVIILPSDAAAGKSWTVSFGAKDNETVYNYTIESVNDGVVNLNFKGTQKQNNTLKMQGMDAIMKADATFNGTAKVQLKTNLVLSRSIKIDSNGTTEVMGMSLPVTTKTTTEDTFEYK